MVAPEIAVEEQRLALARVLDSRTFSRSDQLRAFLRYVCEAAFEGRAHELNEYALGVSVLGRRAGYSPAEDSGVRTRAYELRNKLKAYYRDEAPEDPIQIEIEKGAYVPRFHRRENTAPEKPPAAPEKTPCLRAGRAVARRARRGAAAQDRRLPGALGYRRARARRRAGDRRRWVVLEWANETRERRARAARRDTRDAGAVEAVSRRDTSAADLVRGSRLFFYAPATGLVVRDSQTNQVSEAAQSKPLAAFQERMGGRRAASRPTTTPTSASVQAAFLLGRLLDREAGLKYASALGWEDVWNSNVIFVGKSDVNPTIRRVLRDANPTSSTANTAPASATCIPLPGEPSRVRDTRRRTVRQEVRCHHRAAGSAARVAT